MRRPLFLRIVAGVVAVDPYFQPQKDALGVRGLSTLQKIMATHRQLCYGMAADAVDEYLRIGQSTALQCLHRFCNAVVLAFGAEFLRDPNREDIEKQLRINANIGMPGMFGSLDCTHWVWKNCPVSWQGQFQDRKKQRSIILEAICTQDLHIWHWYFGIPGSNNDINVVDRSPLLSKLLHNSVPEAQFTVNGNQYKRTYLLADGIYPDMPIFMKTIAEPQEQKKKYYATVQEACRKDIERCFGVLKARFALFCNPSRLWHRATMTDVIKACICLHNMICADEYTEPELDNGYLFESFVQPEEEEQRPEMNFEILRRNMADVQNSAAYYTLRNDLVDHLWTHKGNQ